MARNLKAGNYELTLVLQRGHTLLLLVSTWEEKGEGVGLEIGTPVGQEAEIGTPEGLGLGIGTAEVDMEEILEMIEDRNLEIGIDDKIQNKRFN